MNFRRPRRRDEKHLAFIRGLPCCVCHNDIETEAAHIRSGELAMGKYPTGGGEKPSDCWTVPLCGKHHREQHARGDEIAWWRDQGINPFIIAMALYASTSDFVAATDIIEHRGNGHSFTPVPSFVEPNLA